MIQTILKTISQGTFGVAFVFLFGSIFFERSDGEAMSQIGLLFMFVAGIFQCVYLFDHRI